MTWGEALENVNYLSVVVGALVSVVTGVIWYAPKVFGNEWMKLVGLKKKDMENKEGMASMVTVSVVFYFLATLAIAVLMQLTNMLGAFEGAVMGALAGFVFGFGPLVVTYGFARRKFELSMIDGAYIVITLALAGLVVGLW